MHLFFLSCLLFLTLIRAALVNHTIDDGGQDQATGLQPAYFPADAWKQCPGGCFIDPAANKGVQPAFANNGTWHENLNGNQTNTTMTLSFTGTAVYVYIMLFAYSGTQLTFYMDGINQVGVYSHPGEQNPLKGPEFYYQVLAYANSSLSNGQHNLVLENAINSLALFDFAVYSTDGANDTSSTSSAGPSATGAVPATKTNNTGLIAGVTVAGIVALLAIGGFFYYRHRTRRFNKPQESAQSLQQFITPYSSAQPYPSTVSVTGNSVSEHTRTYSAGTMPQSSAPHLAVPLRKMPLTQLSPPVHTDSGFRSTDGIPPHYTEV